MDFTLTDAVNAYFAQVAIINQLWNFWGLFAGAVVTVMWSVSKEHVDDLKRVFIVGFGLFAVVNGYMIGSAQYDLSSIETAIAETVRSNPKGTYGSLKPVIDTMTAFPWLIAVFCHVGLDIVVLCAVSRRKAESSDN